MKKHFNFHKNYTIHPYTVYRLDNKQTKAQVIQKHNTRHIIK